VDIRVKPKAFRSSPPSCRAFLLSGRELPIAFARSSLILLSNSIKFTEKAGLKIQVGPDPESGAGLLRFASPTPAIGIPGASSVRLFRDFPGRCLHHPQYGRVPVLVSHLSKQLVELMEGPHLGGRANSASAARFSSPPISDFRPTRPIARRPRSARTPTVALEAAPSWPEDSAGRRSDDNRNTHLLLPGRTSLANRHRRENGLLATLKFAEARYDLILMDVEMPVMDGYEATVQDPSAEAETGATPTPVFCADCPRLRR